MNGLLDLPRSKSAHRMEATLAMYVWKILIENQNIFEIVGVVMGCVKIVGEIMWNLEWNLVRCAWISCALFLNVARGCLIAYYLIWYLHNVWKEFSSMH